MWCTFTMFSVKSVRRQNKNYIFIDFLSKKCAIALESFSTPVEIFEREKVSTAHMAMHCHTYEVVFIICFQAFVGSWCKKQIGVITKYDILISTINELLLTLRI